MSIKNMHPPLVATLIVLIIVLLIAAPAVGAVVLIWFALTYRTSVTRREAYEAKRKSDWGF